MSQRPTHVRWTIVGLACGSSWLLYLHRYSFAFIKPYVTEELHLDKRELGLLDSAFSLAYSLFQIPLGFAVDTWGVRIGLTAMLLVASCGLALHAWAAGPLQLMLARATLGAGQSAVYAALTRLSAQWYPARVRSTLQGLVGVTAGRVGGLSASLLLGTLLLGVWALDWRVAIYALAALGLFHTVAFVLLFRNTPGTHPWVNAAEAALIVGEGTPPRATAKLSIGGLLRQLTPRGKRNLIALNVQSVLSTFADNIYSNWIPLFLWEVHSLKAKEMGLFSALPLLGGAIAGGLSGWLTDCWLARTGNRRWARSGVAACGKAIAAVWLLLAMQCYDQPYVFCGMLFLVKLFGDWSVTTMVGVVTDVGGPATASVYAFNNTVAGIGSVLAPAIFGDLVQRSGWPVVFYLVAAIYGLCALSWLWVNCTVPIVSESFASEEDVPSVP